MKAIFAEILVLAQKNEPFVLATVVRTRGSTPQKPGAKILIRRDRSLVGTIGGGCIEADVCELAAEMLAEHAPPRLQSYDLNEDPAMGDGMVCGGSMFVYLEPSLAPRQDWPFAEILATAGESTPAVALLTILAATAPYNVGDKILISEDGAILAKTTGAVVEPEWQKLGRRVAASGECRWIKLANDVEIFAEGFAAPPLLILVGAGHVNTAVARLAAMLDYRLAVIDDRPEFASAERFPEAETVLAADYAEALQSLQVPANSMIIIATRGHKYDDRALAAALQTPARFIGLLGSKRKVLTIYRNLLQDGADFERLRQVHAPIGLNIGAMTPAELAVSIMAEIILLRRGGDGQPMRLPEGLLRENLVQRARD